MYRRQPGLEPILFSVLAQSFVHDVHAGQCYGLTLRFSLSSTQLHSFVHGPSLLRAPRLALTNATGGEGLDPNDLSDSMCTSNHPMSPVIGASTDRGFRSVIRAPNGPRWHRRRSPQTASGSHISGVSAEALSDGADAASLQRFARHRHGT